MGSVTTSSFSSEKDEIGGRKQDSFLFDPLSAFQQISLLVELLFLTVQCTLIRLSTQTRVHNHIGIGTYRGGPFPFDTLVICSMSMRKIPCILIGRAQI